MTPDDPMRPSWSRRVFRLPGRSSSTIDAELEAELHFRLDARIAELLAAGQAPEAARVEALRRFGELDGTVAYCRAIERGRAREERRRDWFAGWRQDLGLAL